MLPTRFSLPGMLLRLEGLAAFAISILLYARLDASWLLLVVLALAPDLSAIGYLGGQRAGTIAYNTAHTYTLPAILGGVGLIVDSDLAVSLALIWSAHIGIDRAVGYGLKYESAFKDTHLSRV